MDELYLKLSFPNNIKMIAIFILLNYCLIQSYRDRFKMVAYSFDLSERPRIEERK